MAERNMGESRRRILSREILPNLSPPLGAYRPIVMAAPIVAEGPFSSLGMGIPPLQPSWGGMISDGKDAINRCPPHGVRPAPRNLLHRVRAQRNRRPRHQFGHTLHD